MFASTYMHAQSIIITSHVCIFQHIIFSKITININIQFVQILKSIWFAQYTYSKYVETKQIRSQITIFEIQNSKI